MDNELTYNERFARARKLSTLRIMVNKQASILGVEGSSPDNYRKSAMDCAKTSSEGYMMFLAADNRRIQILEKTNEQNSRSARDQLDELFQTGKDRV